MVRRTLMMGVWVGAWAAWQAGGCAGPLRCTYKTGDVQRVRYTVHDTYWSWVEMPDEPATAKDGQDLNRQVSFRQEVESVQPDGSAVLRVTLDEVHVQVRKLLHEKETLLSYLSTAQKTESTSPGEPKLAGVTYRLRVAPDSTVLEVLDLDQVRRQVGETAEQRGVMSLVLAEKALRQMHEHGFLQSAVSPGGKAVRNEPLPHFMIKAQAIRQEYTAGSVQQSGAHKLVTVQGRGEPLHQLPKGWPSPPEPPDPGRTFLKNVSDMEQLSVTGTAAFDPAAGRVARDERKLSCRLVVLGEKVFKDRKLDQTKAKDEGILPTEVAVEETYELLP